MPVYLILTGLSEALNRVQQENQQRQETERLLRESERKFRDIANNIPGLVFQFRVPHHGSDYFSYISPRGLELLDFTIIPNSPGYELGANVHPEDKAAFLASINQAIANRSTWRYEGRMLNSQGNIIWVQGIASPSSTEDELVFDGILLDVTERKRLEERLYQAQKMEAVGRLSGGIAHDFNNILVPIIGYVELAMMDMAPDDKGYANLKQVREAADRAASLTRQILAFSRKQLLQMQVLDLNAVVVDFKVMIQRLIREDIEFETFLAADLYRVKADKGQLEQVLMNLVVNARDAMPTGGNLAIETANVYLDETYVKKYGDNLSPGHYAMLSVSDTGAGMNAEIQQQIFEPFFTTKAQGVGTGLGLATVFGIVKQHGGNIWVYSELDKGTTFKIYLPRTPEAEHSVEIPQVEPGSLSGAETILVVEDEEMVRHLVCETLAAFGYKVIEAKNGNEGLRRASEHKETLHLLLTDVIMPKMDGRELYKHVVAIHPAIKVLYMSGYPDNFVVHHDILEEGTNFLQKPFTVHSLLQKIKQVLS
jgi:signal transduction histidine kinase